MADITYPLFTIVAFMGFILSLIPLPWHLQAWNSGTCYFMMWTALANLNQFVNSIVWAGNYLNHSPVWCEISIRITMGAVVGIPAASLCINRRLYSIASVKSVAIGPDEKRRAILIDTLICVLLPLIYVALQYCVQGHRFNIFEDIGCVPALYNSLPAFFISDTCPLVIGLVSGTYCVLSLLCFSRRRLEFNQFVNSNASSMTLGRYFRLMALAMSDILTSTPITIFTIWLNATAQPINPWRSWSDTHVNYSRIVQVPAVLWHSNRLLVIATESTRWLIPFCAFVFFAFFGFADEAMKNYRKVFLVIAKCLGFEAHKPSGSLPGTPIGYSSKPKSQFTDTSIASSPTLPTYSPPLSSSFYPITLSTSDQTLRCSVGDKDVDQTSPMGLVSPTETSYTPQPHMNRFSWKSLDPGSIDRRHSSYV